MAEEKQPEKKPENLTTKYTKKRNLYFCISMILNFGPLLGCIIYALFSGQIETVQRFAIGGTVSIAIILFSLNGIFKLNLRCPVFFILLGICIAFYKTQNLVIGIVTYLCIATTVDELVLTPLYKDANDKLKIHKELDKRL